MRCELLGLRILRLPHSLRRAPEVVLSLSMLYTGTEHQPVGARLTERHTDAARVDDPHAPDGPVELHVCVPAYHDRHVEALEHRAQAFFRRMTRERLGVAARRRVAEEHVAKSRDLELHRNRPLRDRLALIGKQLVAHPSHDLTKRGRNARRVTASELREHLTLAVPLDELDGDLACEEIFEGLARHRPEDRVAPDHDQVDGRTVDLLDGGLERGEITMDVVEGRDPHP